MSTHDRLHRDDGFSLFEVMVALSILMVGLLGLAQVFYYGLSIAGTSSAQLIAREKAREAVESVHTARDTRVITIALQNLVGTQGENWHLLTSAAFISMALPLAVFFSLQRYFVRGLLAGSVK